MKTNFTAAQQADPTLTQAIKAVRTCTHTGMCTATCPTYLVTCDERDGPRGRIQMIQRMLEANETPAPETVFHLDRCLSCLNCRSFCPSSVDYARLIDTARAHIQTRFRRPAGDRLLRWFVARILTRPALVRCMLFFAPLGRWLPGRLGAVVRKAPRPAKREPFASPERVQRRLALLPGCVQKAIAPNIDAAVSRVLARRGIELSPLPEISCCGALLHHLGRDGEAKAYAKRIITAYEVGSYDGLFMSSTGCEAHLKDLPHLFDGDLPWRARAARVSDQIVDLLQLVEPMGRLPVNFRIACHEPCSLQNGLRLPGRAESLLVALGAELTDIDEKHVCCGSAGSYSILQPELSSVLRDRKLFNIMAGQPDIIVSTNIGCQQQLACDLPIFHIAEVIDFCEGGSSTISVPKRDNTK